MTRALRDLLTTWQDWSTRNTMRRAIEAAGTETSKARLTANLADAPEVSALDALRDATELISLLSGWQWQAVHGARVEDGASWEQIADATRVTVEQARADYTAAVERAEAVGLRDAETYRRAL